MIPGFVPTARTRAFVQWTIRHGKLLWIVALLLAVPATWRTVSLYAHLHTEIEELLPRESPSVKALNELRDRSPGLQFLGVVGQVADDKDLPAAERFMDDLAARVRAYPPELVKDARSSNAGAKAFLEKHGALYVDLDDLKEIRRRIEARRDYEVSKAAGQLVDDDQPEPSVDTSDLEDKYKDRLHDEQDAHFTSAPLKATLLVVEAGDFSTGVAKARTLLSRVQADVAWLDPSSYSPGLRVGYASDVAINVEELNALEDDLSLSSLLVFAAVITVIMLYYQWYKAVPILLAPLLLATVYTFGLAALPPMRINELNSNTAFLGSIIIGNGINVGLILLARYREERLAGTPVDEALVHGVAGARAGTLAAALAAGVAYASLVVTEFRGFRQFGVIGGIGMVMAWAMAFVLMPPLIRWLDTDEPAPESAVRRHGLLMRWVLRLVQKGAVAIVAVSAVLALGSAYQISKFDSSRLEHDFNKLRRFDTWKNGAGYWGKTMDSLLGHYLTPTVILCDSPQQARDIDRVIRDSVEHGKLKPMVARVISADDIIPLEQNDKLREAQAIRRALTPKIRASMTEERRKQLDDFLGAESLQPIKPADVPRAFVTGLREKDGSIGRTLLVYPAPSDVLWKAAGIHSFVDLLRGYGAQFTPAGERPARVAGSIPLSGDILESIGRDAPVASVVSFLGVVGVVLLVVRRRRTAIAVIGSLLLGVLWLAGATMFLGIKVNFSNFIAFPITFGIGVDYAVNVMARYVQDGERDVKGAIRSTGGAVALCSLTTIIGYSSLLLAKNRALFLFGLVAVMGEIACLSAAVIALPAWLLLTQRLRHRQVN